MFIAEVLAIHADERYIDEKGAFDISKCDLIAYSNGGYYVLGKKIGKFGFSVQKKKQNIEKRENYEEKTNKNSKFSNDKKYNKSSKEEKNTQNIVKKHIARKKKFKKK